MIPPASLKDVKFENTSESKGLIVILPSHLSNTPIYALSDQGKILLQAENRVSRESIFITMIVANSSENDGINVNDSVVPDFPYVDPLSTQIDVNAESKVGEHTVVEPIKCDQCLEDWKSEELRLRAIIDEKQQLTESLKEQLLNLNRQNSKLRRDFETTNELFR